MYTVPPVTSMASMQQGRRNTDPLSAIDLPSVIENLPTGLVGYGTQGRGLDPDGWLAQSSAFELMQPMTPAELLVQGKVPVVDHPGFTTELRVLLDGDEVSRTSLGTGWFAVRTPVAAGPTQRHVELQFTAVQRLPAPDIRLVGAYAQRIGFEARPVSQIQSDAVPVALATNAAPVSTLQIEATRSALPAANAGLVSESAPLPRLLTELEQSHEAGVQISAFVAPAAVAGTTTSPDVPTLATPSKAPAPRVPTASALPPHDVEVVASAGRDEVAAGNSPAHAVAAPGNPSSSPLPVLRTPHLPPPPARIFATQTVIGPAAAPLREQLQEMWRHRHLFQALVWRNIRVEFDATRLGSIWAIARPLLFAAVFTFFRNLSGANTYVDIPYVPYIFSGLLLWTYFTDVATNTASAIRSDLGLLTKVYYPRLLTPLVPAVSNLTTLLIGMVPLAGMMLWMGLHPGWMLLLMPVVLLPVVVLALGIGLVVSSLSIEDRDWERVLAYSLTIGLWISPVIYSPEMIPQHVRLFYQLNPVAGPLLAFRAVLFDGVPFPFWQWAYSAVSSCLVLALGLRVFRQTEVRLVDRL